MSFKTFIYRAKPTVKVCHALRDYMPLRTVTASTVCRHSNWQQAVSNAEKVVGYPTSFLSLRCLMSDEVSNIAVYLKKIIGTGHPLLSTAKKLVYSQDKSHQTRGLIVLLVSKASNGNKSSDVLQGQRSLAEITELIHTAHLIHSGVINLQSPDSNLEMGNKMAILCGDFLLAHVCVTLSGLENPKIVELISEAIADISAAEFIQISNAENENPMERWLEQTKLRYGTLLANACESSLILAGNVDLAPEAHSFGQNIALAWQANTELQNYIKSKDRRQQTLSILYPSQPFSEVVANFKNIRNTYVENALSSLTKFPKNEASAALCKIILALKN